MYPKESLYSNIRKRKIEDYEFGYPDWKYMYHLMPDKSIAVSYAGRRIAEIRPNGSALIFLQRCDGAIINRWRQLFAGLSFSAAKKKHANGIVRHTVTVFSRSSTWPPVDTPITTIEADQVIQVLGPGGEIDVRCVDPVTKTAEKDNDKYRAFNKQLKALRAVLSSQSKMGVYTEYTIGPFYGTSGALDKINKYMTELIGKEWHDYSRANECLYEHTRQWIATQDPALTKTIMLLMIFRHRSSTKNTINNALRYIQTRYLREECVTIRTSKNTLLDQPDERKDQDGELLTPDGFREVQVPSEAKIC